MKDFETVELVVAGARLPVLRDAGFELFERNRALLDEGRLELAEVLLQEDPSMVLHLVLGAQQLALIEQQTASAETDHSDPASEGHSADSAELTAAEVFPDFGAYLQ